MYTRTVINSAKLKRETQKRFWCTAFKKCKIMLCLMQAKNMCV